MFNKVIEKLKDKKGIEFGGPTELFYNPIFNLSLYENVFLDCGNMLDDNSFDHLNGHNNKSDFFYYGNKIGNLYNVDCTNENDLIKLYNYDFVVTSHVIEHIANPIKTINFWKNLLCDNGYILTIIPDYRFCFDRNRKLTTMEHLINDYKTNIGEDDNTHIQEQIDLHDWSMGGHPNFINLCKNNYKSRVVHHHTFDIKLIEELFQYCGFQKILSYKHDNLNIINLSQKI